MWHLFSGLAVGFLWVLKFPSLFLSPYNANSLCYQTDQPTKSTAILIHNSITTWFIEIKIHFLTLFSVITSEAFMTKLNSYLNLLGFCQGLETAQNCPSFFICTVDKNHAVPPKLFQHGHPNICLMGVWWHRPQKHFVHILFDIHQTKFQQWS